MCRGGLYLPYPEGQSVRTSSELGRSGKTLSIPRQKPSDPHRLANAQSAQLALRNWFNFHGRVVQCSWDDPLLSGILVKHKYKDEHSNSSNERKLFSRVIS